VSEFQNSLGSEGIEIRHRYYSIAAELVHFSIIFELSWVIHVSDDRGVRFLINSNVMSVAKRCMITEKFGLKLNANRKFIHSERSRIFWNFFERCRMSWNKTNYVDCFFFFSFRSKCVAFLAFETDRSVTRRVCASLRWFLVTSNN